MGVCYWWNMTCGCLDSAKLFAWSDIGTDSLYRKAGLSALHWEEFHTPFAAHMIILWSYSRTLSPTVSLSPIFPCYAPCVRFAETNGLLGSSGPTRAFSFLPLLPLFVLLTWKLIVFYLYLISKSNLDFKKDDNAFLHIFTNTISYCNNWGNRQNHYMWRTWIIFFLFFIQIHFC